MNILQAIKDMKTNELHEGLGVHDGKLKELPQTSNCVSTQTDQKSKRVDPLPYKGTAAESKAVLLAYFADKPEVEVITDEPNYLYVVYTSAKHQWKDDVEFYFDDANQRIEFRSGSRTGFGDMGVNKKRYETIKAAYLG